MSPLNHTSLNLLDKQEPVEVVLEIPSFAGGENTIGEDQDLKTNEARIIQNWDSISLGGMIRAAGFSLVASLNEIDSYTALMLHMDGTNGSTTFTDSSLTPNTVTANGDAKISTAQSKFGGAAGLFDGTGDYLSIPDSANWFFSTGDFTIDTWVRITADSGLQVVISQSDDANNFWRLLIDADSSVLTFTVVSASVTTLTHDFTWNPAANTWYHLAFVRNGNVFTAYIDGTSIGTVTDVDPIPNLAAVLNIGRESLSGGQRYFTGYMDEFRISKGIARWTANFTPSTIAYSSSGVASDLLLHHYEGTSTRNYVLTSGNLRYINGTNLVLSDAAAFTSGVLSHGVTAGSKAWITNATDNLKYTTIAGSITVPTTVPPSARERIYYHKFRLVAEGGGVTVYGSKAGSGTWAGAGGWTASGDAWSIDLPDLTKGCVPGFPSPDYITVFTENSTYGLYNFPNVAWQPIEINRGCSAPYSIAYGKEGVFFVSKYPTLGVFLWDGTNFTNLTIYEDFPTDINFSNRIFGIYKENRYYLSYSSTFNGASYPDKMCTYDTRFGRWTQRPVNTSLADNFGYPAVILKPSNSLYAASSRKTNIYQLESGTSDSGYDTISNYQTKDFSSKDFTISGAYPFPLDEVRIKLLKVSVSYYGSTGSFSIAWTSDRGLHTGSQNFVISAAGDLINSTFIVNSSMIASPPPTRTVTRSFGNSAIGKRFDFQILHQGQSDRVKIKKIKIFGLALNES